MLQDPNRVPARKKSSDVLDLLLLLELEEKLIGIEAGDLVFFQPRKMSMTVISGHVMRPPTYMIDIFLGWTFFPDHSTTAMFLGVDTRHMTFLIEENIVQLDVKDFGTLWAIKKITQ